MNRDQTPNFAYIYKMLGIAVAVATLLAMCGLCSRCVPL